MDINEDPVERINRRMEEFREQKRHADRELFKAIADDNPERVSSWLRRGASINAPDGDGRTPLFHAVTPPWRSPAIAEVLLNGGANVRECDLSGGTPLHAAALFGNRKHLALLLDRGAQIDARDAGGVTPLHCAATRGRLEEAMFLVVRGADMGLRDYEGRTPLDRVRTNPSLGQSPAGIRPAATV